MKVNNEFEVNRPIDTVWDTFQDVPTVAQCLPGATLTEDKGGNAYAGVVEVKLGPMSAKFEGEARISPDESTRSGHIAGKGVDRSGGSRGQVDVQYRLTEAGAKTQVFVDADIKLSGAIAQFGRTGLVEEMSKRLIDEFVECLEAKLSAVTTEEAAEIRAGDLKGLPLFFASLSSWVGKFLKRLFGRRED